MSVDIGSRARAPDWAKKLMVCAMLACASVALSGCANKNPLEDPALAGAGAGGAGRAVPGSPQDFAASVGDRVFFDSDSAELNASARETLDKQARWLNQYPRYSITLEGHADERGTREYNVQLGKSRAQAASDYLGAKGVSAARMRTASFGKERPVAVCDDISCWSQNRRAVTVLGGGRS